MLLQLLGQDLCRRVNSHLEQAVVLLDLVLTHAKVSFRGRQACYDMFSLPSATCMRPDSISAATWSRPWCC